jgi:hypothetical protein
MALFSAPLEQRVQRLLESEGAVVIDSTLITIQEYLSFITDEQIHSRFRQPDHWATPTDPTGNADNPVIGVRPEDAQSFCVWLQERSSVASEGYFRLPGQGEISSVESQDVTPWVTTGGTVVLAADEQLQQQWAQEILQQIQDGLDTDLNCDFDLPLHWRMNKNTVRDTALERARNRNRNSPLQQRLRERRTTMGRIWSVNPDGFPDAALRLKRTLRKIYRQWPILSIYYELARDLDRAIREAEELSLIRAYLLCVHTAWDCCCIDIEEKDSSFLLLTKLQQEVDYSFDLYAFVVMVDQRRKGMLPCREVLQLVYERLT